MNVFVVANPVYLIGATCLFPYYTTTGNVETKILLVTNTPYSGNITNKTLCVSGSSRSGHRQP